MKISGNENYIKLLRLCGWCLACGVFLSACSLTKDQVPDEPPLPAQQLESTSSEGRLLPLYRQLIESLLVQAKKAFRHGRYTLPEHDNALDKFRSILLLDPNNREAKSGLQAVRLKLAELARETARNGDFQGAQVLVERILTVFSSDALVDNLKQDIARIKSSYKSLSADSPELAGTAKIMRELILPKRALSARAESVKTKLGDLAQRLKQTEEGILIYARNDTEGRWIYRQLKAASPDYRIRGDIRIDKKPRIELLPPY